MARTHAHVLARRQLDADLKRAKHDLFFLATEILDYGLLTREFHQPMMDDMDRLRIENIRRVMNGRPPMPDLELWARDYYKTTVAIARCVQDYLWDPGMTTTWFHAIEDKAQESSSEVGRHFQTNKKLRRLWPEIMPSLTAKKWVTASGFRFAANKDKAPSLVAMGAGSEHTGGHSRRIYMDDIVGLNDIEDNLMPKKRRWYGLTVRNVLRTDVGWLSAIGTRWDENDIWNDFLKNARWKTRVRACYEKDGVPDWDGDPVLYNRDAIETKRREMSRYEFSCQMMNDPLPSTERIWVQDCENFVSMKQVEGDGVIIALSDPAPALVGSFDGKKEKERQDGSKNYWANCVVKLRRVGELRQIILLYGEASQEWPIDEGFRRLCEIALRWRASKISFEATGNAIATYIPRFREVKQHVGTRAAVVEMEGTYTGNAKNVRFEALCSRARSGEFLIAESVPKPFLDAFLEQARGWRVQGFRNSLRFDDCADVVAMATDPAFNACYPTFTTLQEDEMMDSLSFYEPRSRTRHIWT